MNWVALPDKGGSHNTAAVFFLRAQYSSGSLLGRNCAYYREIGREREKILKRAYNVHSPIEAHSSLPFRVLLRLFDVENQGLLMVGCI